MKKVKYSSNVDTYIFFTEDIPLFIYFSHILQADSSTPNMLRSLKSLRPMILSLFVSDLADFLNFGLGIVAFPALLRRTFQIPATRIKNYQEREAQSQTESKTQLEMTMWCVVFPVHCRKLIFRSSVDGVTNATTYRERPCTLVYFGKAFTIDQVCSHRS